MGLTLQDQIHGAALIQLVKDPRFTALSHHADHYGHYLVTTKPPGSKAAVREVFTKYSTATGSPWLFTFQAHEIVRIANAKRRKRSAYVALVCGTSGVCVLDTDELWAIVDRNPASTDQQQVRVEKPKGGSYRASAKGYELIHTIPANAFPNKVLS